MTGGLNIVKREKRMSQFESETHHFALMDMFKIFADGLCCDFGLQETNQEIASHTSFFDATQKIIIDVTRSVVVADADLGTLAYKQEIDCAD